MRAHRGLVHLTLVATAVAWIATPAAAQCDPEEAQKLTASDAAPFDRFGISSAIDGETAVVGAYLHGGTGSAYVYRLEGGAWVEQQQLIPATVGPGDWFGVSVAISGDRIIVGAQNDDDRGSDAGAAYIFRRDSNGQWIEEAKLAPGDLSATDWAGHSVAISGTLAVFSAQLDDGGATDAGAAHVFRYDGANWQHEAVLRASDPGSGDEFGTSVATDGTAIAVGARWDNDAGADSGSAYVFRQDGDGVWQQEAKLTAFDAAGGDEFGFAASVDGDIAAVGSRLEDDAGSNAGAVYIYQHDGAGDWRHEAKLIPQPVAADDRFGETVALRGGLLLAGARQHDALGSEAGAAFLFRRLSDGAWVEEATLLASDGAAGDFFGISVGHDGQRAIVGANLDDDGGDQTGSAYVFDFNCASTETVCPDTFTQLRGIPVDGGFADACGSDDARWAHQPDALAATLIAPIEIEFEGALTGDAGSAIRFIVEDHATEPGVVLRLSIYNFATELFEGVVFPDIATTDTEHAIEKTTSVADYIGPSGEVRARVAYFRPAGVPPFWTIAIDDARFELDG